MSNSENRAIIYYTLFDLFVDLNMMIVIVLMYYMQDKTDHYLNNCINNLNKYSYYHSFLVYIIEVL